MQSDIVNLVFGTFSSIIREKCIENPPKIINGTHGESEEMGFVHIVREYTKLSILPKKENPNYIAFQDAYIKNNNDWRFTDFDRREGDFYLSGYRIDLKVSSQNYDTRCKNPLPKWVAGSIPLSSLIDFPHGDGRSLYYCVSKDWTRQFLVSADETLAYALKHQAYRKHLETLRQLKKKGEPIALPKSVPDVEQAISIDELSFESVQEIF